MNEIDREARVIDLARRFHDEYERQAEFVGWKSQTPVPFDELPLANKQTMLRTCAVLLESTDAQLITLTAENHESNCCAACSHDRRKSDLVAIWIPREWARRWANDEPWTPNADGQLSDYRKAENVIIEGARHALGLDSTGKEVHD